MENGRRRLAQVVGRMVGSGSPRGREFSMKKFIPNALLLVAATTVGVLAMELGLRVLHPITFMHVETQEADGVGGIVPDRDLGWRPALGTNEYDGSGILLSRSIYPK